LPGSTIGQQKSLKDQLIGAWTLVSAAPNGAKYFGANPKGILILDASGRFAVVQGRPDRPKFKTSNDLPLRETPAAEYGEAARAFAAGFGTWFVNEADKTLILRLEGALIPNAEGAETKVSVSLAGDELKLTAANAPGEDTVYRRAKDESAWPLAVPAQQPALPVVGILGLGSPRPDAAIELRQDLAAAGFVEGRTVAIAYRGASGQLSRLAPLAAELVQRRVAVIVAYGGPAVLAAKAATSTIPIVFGLGGDPTTFGLVGSLGRPGGNMTGVASLSSKLTGKQLDLLCEVAPLATTVAYLTDPRAQDSEEATSDMLAAARTLGRQTLILEARNPLDIDTAFATLVERGAGALVVGPHALFAGYGKKIVELAARHNIPAIYFDRWFVVAGGGLMSYAADPVEGRRLHSFYVTQILRGAKPADLPVQQPTKFEFVINLKTAKALGLTIPETLLATADEVIQ
jgi:putative ABC transport system substrate-binding protein